MWHLTLHTRGPGDPTLGEDELAAHLDWIKAQQLRGTLLFAGPSADGSLGIMVFGHMPEAEVERICQTDPLIAGRRKSFQIIPWDVHQVLGVGGFAPGQVTHPGT